ncbi:Hypothetical predicted protein [Octopus vulgaris]|uniref:Reverse transcriptase domain-containing protein n=1 Tax=Octopus vulgaris TaxID=6645 RepID=A0AA36EX82_OCTVU|nr:Hypothetical predicted protein [Octopus vulgaris]
MFSPTLRNFLSVSMRSWRTTLTLNSDDESLNAGDVKISCGIFQGDSLSPLLFCLAVIPLSKLLIDAQYGYKMLDENINHIIYMDGLKLFAKNDQQLKGLLTIVKQFSDDIRLQFGLNKCAKATFIKEKMTETSNVYLDQQNTIKELDPAESYKYLGVIEGGWNKAFSDEGKDRERMLSQSKSNTQDS